MNYCPWCYYDLDEHERELEEELREEWELEVYKELCRTKPWIYGKYSEFNQKQLRDEYDEERRGIYEAWIVMHRPEYQHLWQEEVSE